MKLSCEIHCFSTIIIGTGSLLVLCNQVEGWPPWEELTHFTILTLMPLSIQSLDSTYNRCIILKLGTRCNFVSCNQIHDGLTCVCVLSHVWPFATLLDCSLPGSSFHGDSPGKNTGVGCHALLQGIFPNQGSNPWIPASLVLFWVHCFVFTLHAACLLYITWSLVSHWYPPIFLGSWYGFSLVFNTRACFLLISSQTEWLIGSSVFVSWAYGPGDFVSTN